MSNNPWENFLKKIKGSVDDAIVIYKGGNDINKSGIYAQITDNNEEVRLWPKQLELEQWIKFFQEIGKLKQSIENKEDKLELKLKCTIKEKERRKEYIFYIIEYDLNFIRAHLFDGNHRSLFLSQSRDFIFVGYCSPPKIKTPSQSFCAIEGLARFIRDCELYHQMKEVGKEEEKEEEEEKVEKVEKEKEEEGKVEKVEKVEKEKEEEGKVEKVEKVEKEKEEEGKVEKVEKFETNVNNTSSSSSYYDSYSDD